MLLFSSPPNGPTRWGLQWRQYLILANLWISSYTCHDLAGKIRAAGGGLLVSLDKKIEEKQKKHRNKIVDNNKSLIYRRMKLEHVAGSCTHCISLREQASWPKHVESEPLPRGHSCVALDTQTAFPCEPLACCSVFWVPQKCSLRPVPRRKDKLLFSS